MVLKSIIAFNFLLVSFCSFAQNNFLLKGTILSKSNGDPMPYAHINIQNAGIGTISNSEGYFKLLIPLDYTGTPIKISCIGYKSQFYTISSKNTADLKFFLDDDIEVLKSVVITPYDHARGIVLTAIERISTNYPSENEILKGFISEIAYPDSTDLPEPFYRAEAVIEAYKISYSKTTASGDVRLLKGRNYTSKNFDSLKLCFYGGAHDPHRFDFVMRRDGPINKNNIYKYKFELTDTTKYENEHLFVISFHPTKGAKESGRLYITSDSHAIVKGEFYYTADNSQNLNDKFGSLIKGYERVYKQYTAEYSNYDSTWRLKYVLYNTRFRNNSETIFLRSSFTTTDFYPHAEAIPYADRIQFGDVFLKNTGEYDPNFWDDYNIVLSTANLQDSVFYDGMDFNSPPKATKLQKFLTFVKKLRGSYGFFYFKSDISSFNVVSNKSTIPINQEFSNQTHHYTGLLSSIQYKLSDQLIVGLENRGSFSSTLFSGNWINFTYQINLTPNRRPFCLSRSVQAGYTKQRLLLDSFAKQQEISINGKAFDSKRINFFLESRGYSFRPSLSLSIEKSSRLRFFVTAEYDFYFESKQGLYLREDQSFLKRKSTFIEENQSKLIIESRDKAVFSNSPNVLAGITLTL